MTVVKAYANNVHTYVTSENGSVPLDQNNCGLVVLTGVATGYAADLLDCTYRTTAQLAYRLVNATTQPVDIQDYDVTVLATLAAGEAADILLLSGGTTGGTWRITVLPYVAPPQQVQYYGAMLGSASGVVGYLSSSPSNTSNPGGLGQVHASGYAGGNCAPILVVGNQKITKVKAICGAAAVSQATVGTSPTLRIDVYEVSGTSAAVVTDGELRLTTADASNIGASNALTGTTPVVFELTLGTPLSVSDGTLLGFTFQPENTDNEEVNAVSALTVTVIAEYDV